MVYESCPKCKSRLYEQFGNGITVRICPKCRFQKNLSEEKILESRLKQVQEKARFDFTKLDSDINYVKISQESKGKVVQGKLTTKKVLKQVTKKINLIKKLRIEKSSTEETKNRLTKLIQEAKSEQKQFNSNKLDSVFDFAAMTKKSNKCQVVYEKIEPLTNPTYSNKSLETLIQNQSLRKIVSEKIDKLYSFQVESFEKIVNNENVVITAPTASGKTQAFLIPILQKILQKNNRKGVTALFIYPTKALTGDQANQIKILSEKCGVTINQLDGDSRDNKEYRNHVVMNPPDILATNFDMISWHLCRSEKNQFSKKFVEALKDLQIIVVDETHKCTGFFGANIRWILKRLQRLNPNLQFIASSATLDNPVDFCSKLFPVSMKHIEGIGKRGKFTLQFLRPTIESMDLMIDLTRQFGLRGHQVLTFNQSRKAAEYLAKDGSDEQLDIAIHRSGLTTEERKITESGLRNNTIKAVSCTPTLELGMDIGNVDGVISDFTTPGRLTQRVGRAGRRGQNAFGYMILGDDPISKYYLNNPEEYYKDKKYQTINFDNPFVDENQILLMVNDKPICKNELIAKEKIFSKLVSEGKLVDNGSCYHCTNEGWKSVERCSIRDMGSQVRLYEGNKLIGEVEKPLAYHWVHPGAVYFHGKKIYRSIDFIDGKYPRAILRREHSKDITKPIKSKTANMKDFILSKNQNSINAQYCSVHIAECIHGYHEWDRTKPLEDKRHPYSIEPPLFSNMNTFGILLNFNGENNFGSINKMKFSDNGKSAAADPSLHALEHLMIHAAKMLIGSESHEIDGLIDYNERTILLYDNSLNGGNGFSKVIYEKLDLILKRALEIVKQCKCEEEYGCPSCTHWTGCSHQNDGLSKMGAKDLLESLIMPN